MTSSNYEEIINSFKDESTSAEDIIEKLKALILLKGLPEEEGIEKKEDSLRSKIWKILLRIPEIDVNAYLKLIAKKKSKYGDKIRDDTFRTFTDFKFKSGVQEVKLVRVLNAYCHSMEIEKYPQMTYVQGMTFLLAPFLYVMPEVDAFYCYRRLLLYHMPNYVLTNLQGVHLGAQLLDDVLKYCDPDLYNYFSSKKFTAITYAFSSIMSFLGDALPVNELLKLWDFYLSFGMHMNVVCVGAYYSLNTEKIIAATKSSMNYLKKISDMNETKAKDIIAKAMNMVKQLPPDLLERLIRHPWIKL